MGLHSSPLQMESEVERRFSVYERHQASVLAPILDYFTDEREHSLWNFVGYVGWYQ
jgi:hypothetical protein